ncbi:amidohydrolase family protein [Actinokineospora sp. NBRC 105648]|uniref:amidohydrolase family protein n=1 Tax=Actinokineospora sp. NBRC 105648 TaxID=3032206 RepID=UPI0024A527C9|nr:amidohydrolase family protein [Actinokineospora sp. NBRC 105648]GLZ42035.1 amidohydrolase [Actinokineospora sp. NBRC 105648]
MIVDVHGHISPPESLRRFPMPPSLGDVEGMVERKLAAGIDLTLVGSPVGAGAMVPVPGVDNYAQGTDALRAFHDWLASRVTAFPEHLRALVYANPFGGTEHLGAAAQTYVDGGFVGFVVNTSVAGRYLDDPAAEEFFAMAAELDAPVLLHAPAQPAAGTGLADFRHIEQLGRFCDVTIGVACLVLGGVLERHPGLRLVATAAGGALALLAEKLDLVHRPPHWAAPGGPPTRPLPLSAPPSAYLRRIWVDTSSPSPVALAANLATFGADRLLLGTDSPPLVGMEVPVLSAIGALAVDDDERAAILGGTAAELFGL